MVKVNEFYGMLKAPFPPSEVKWRIGATTQDKSKGQALAYVDARTVYNRFDDVCGNWGWQNNYSHAGGKDTKTICNIGVYLPIGAPDDDIKDVDWDWIWRSNGAGDTDFEAEKGAISDAFKRAAVCHGVGRYLYSIPVSWVEIEQKGRSYVIAKSALSKLQAELGKVATPDYGSIQERAAMSIASAGLNYIPTSSEMGEFAQKHRKAIEALSEHARENFRNTFKKVLDDKKQQEQDKKDEE